MTMKKLIALTAALMSAGLHAQTLFPMPSACDSFSSVDDMLESLAFSLTGQLNTGYVDFTQPFADNPNNVPNALRTKVFVPVSQRAGLVTKHIVVFGDSHGAEQHLVPGVDPKVKQLFSSADLVVGNLESPLVAGPLPDAYGRGGGVQAYNFHMTQAYAKNFATQLGIRPGKAVFTVANNHADDKDRWSMTLASIDQLRQPTATDPQFFDFTGVDEDPTKAPKVTVANLGQVKVGVLGWAHFVNAGASTNPRPWLTDDRAIQRYDANWHLYLPRDFRQLKTDNDVKLLIGIPHWDCQIYSYPHAETIAQTDKLLLNGMDVIVGAHPSTPQPVRIHNEASGFPALAFYSMGQLYQTPNWLPSLSLAADIVIDTQGRILQYSIVPMARFKVPPTNVAAAIATGNGLYGAPAAAPVMLKMLSDIAVERDAHASRYTTFRDRTAVTRMALPPITDTTGKSPLFNTLRTYYVASSTVTQADINDAEVDYNFVRRYERINTLLNKLFQ